MNSKEQNFISAVVYSDKDSISTGKFITELAQCLNEHFRHHEIIVIVSGPSGSFRKDIQEFAERAELSVQLSVINMSLKQSREQCMNAGLDMSIGDYVYEFDSVDRGYDLELVWKAYQSALQGNDIVSVCPQHENIMSRMFYKIFNANSNSLYHLRTNAFTLISRRALNRAHNANVNLAYRKAVYASTGLKMSEIEFDGEVRNNESDKLNLAVDSLVLYTAFGYRFSLRFAALMMAVTLAELLYTLAVWLTGNPVSGWTTTMFVLTFGMTGIFGVLAIILKYLALIIRLSVNRQNYLVESIEKI